MQWAYSKDFIAGGNRVYYYVKKWGETDEQCDEQARGGKERSEKRKRAEKRDCVQRNKRGETDERHRLKKKGMNNARKRRETPVKADTPLFRSPATNRRTDIYCYFFRLTMSFFRFFPSRCMDS